MWNIPTFKDHLQNERAQMRELAAIAETSPMPENPRTRCACGRLTNADMLYDVRALSADLRESANIPDDIEFLCDGCLETIFRNGLLSHADFFEGLGADEGTINAWREYAKSYHVPPEKTRHRQKLVKRQNTP